MIPYVYTLALQGLDVADVSIQTHIGPGMPAFTIVGLPDKIVGESRERIRASLHAIGLAIPQKRITVNLSPADLAKEGSYFDLPILCGLLVNLGIVSGQALSNYLIMGELALDGTLLSVAGVLPAAIGATERKKGLICPKGNGAEAAWSGNADILAPDHLLTLINHFKGTVTLPPPVAIMEPPSHFHPDMSDVYGQETAKRALEIAAAGSHNILLSGSPGTGKSMLASRLPGLLPPLSTREILECSMIASIAGTLTNNQLVQVRPFRAPHHSCSVPAMVGGGHRRPAPGEISLAHNGILFLDELPEFSANALESLRQPLENGNISIARADFHVTYPARFQLVAAMNPCRCGYLSDPERACSKAPACASHYQNKISGPLLDRIDLYVEVPPVSPLDMGSNERREASSFIAERVAKARSIQECRYSALPISTNAEINGSLLNSMIRLSHSCQQLLTHAVAHMKLSMRSYNRVLRVARTIADLEEKTDIEEHHIAEALSYRPFWLSSINSFAR